MIKIYKKRDKSGWIGYSINKNTAERFLSIPDGTAPDYPLFIFPGNLHCDRPQGRDAYIAFAMADAANIRIAKWDWDFQGFMIIDLDNPDAEKKGKLQETINKLQDDLNRAQRELRNMEDK